MYVTRMHACKSMYMYTCMHISILSHYSVQVMPHAEGLALQYFSLLLSSAVFVSVLVIICSAYISPALDETHQVRILARGEVGSCSLLSQLWPAVPSTAGYWGTEQTE